MRITYLPGYERFKQASTPDAQQPRLTIDALKACDVLLLCECDETKIEDPAAIVSAVAQFPVLTVGEREGFLELGGIIHFLVEDKRVHFEINNVGAKQAKLSIRSQLLRLAKRIISENFLTKNGT